MFKENPEFKPLKIEPFVASYPRRKGWVNIHNHNPDKNKFLSLSISLFMNSDTIRK